MSIRKNDQVMVRAGKDRGKKGRVLSVVPATNRVIVEGVHLFAGVEMVLARGGVMRRTENAGRREELVERVHQRRERDMGVGYGSSSGYGASKGSYVRTWRPGMFKFT